MDNIYKVSVIVGAISLSVLIANGLLGDTYLKDNQKNMFGTIAMIAGGSAVVSAILSKTK